MHTWISHIMSTHIYRCRLSFLHQGKPPIAMFDVQNKQPHQKHCAYGMNIHIYLCAVRRIYSWILPHQFRYRTNTRRAFHIDVGRIYVQNRHERCDVFTCCLCSWTHTARAERAAQRVYAPPICVLATHCARYWRRSSPRRTRQDAVAVAFQHRAPSWPEIQTKQRTTHTHRSLARVPLLLWAKPKNCLFIARKTYSSSHHSHTDTVVPAR